ncbi:MAG: hypothetical protein JXA18_10215 [Chitinispirillaceae bacterium]|nr:hypothetical protein [Chitinispirillaceae bacterium]
MSQKIRRFFTALFLFFPVLQIRAETVEEVTAVSFPSEGALPSQQNLRRSISNYGMCPLIILTARPDNGFNVAYHLPSASTIVIVSCDKEGIVRSRLRSDVFSGAQSLLGFAEIEPDGSYAVACSRSSTLNGDGFEYWISRVDGSGGEIFSTRLFGNIHKDTLDSKGEPGGFCSARLVYNSPTEKLGFYTGHTQLYSDGVRHQGGYVGFMTLTGTFVVTDGWYYSHNFDQRMMVQGPFYYTLAHGDAYPRGLGFAKWEDVGERGRRIVNRVYFPIPGEIGDNKTSTQTGGFVRLSNGNFGIVFSTALGRSNFDIHYQLVDSTGDTLSRTCLTEYPADTTAFFPKIANYGENVLLMWEEVVSRAVVAIRTLVVTPEGTALSASSTTTSSSTLNNRKAHLSPYYDPAVLPNGDIVWAAAGSSDSITVFRIASPAGSRAGTFFKSKKGAGISLRAVSGAVEFIAERSAPYRIRHYRLDGRLMEEQERFFPSGAHLLKPKCAEPFLLNVESEGEVQRIMVPLLR